MVSLRLSSPKNRFLLCKALYIEVLALIDIHCVLDWTCQPMAHIWCVLSMKAYSMFVSFLHSCTFLYSGAGIYGKSNPISNNGLIIYSGSGIAFECISNASQSGVGNITTPDGTVLLPTGDQSTGFWRLTNPFERPGVVRLVNRSPQQSEFSDVGIYTCNIPDSNGTLLSLNVGLYSHNFNSKSLFCSVYVMKHVSRLITQWPPPSHL